MKHLLRRRRGLVRLATAATAALLASATFATTAGPAVAAEPPRATPAAPFNFLSAILPSGQMYVYLPDGKGGYDPRSGGYVWKNFRYDLPIDLDQTGSQDGAYHVMNDGTLNLWRGGVLTRKATGWNQYTAFLAPGNLGGANRPDLLARDKQGVLWSFKTRADGSLSPRVRIGAGWGAYTQLAGIGDLSGDRKADIVARDAQGVLWLYKGTGDARKPFAPRTRVGAGWNQFNKLVATGDVDRDGRSDLLARDPKGNLWLYRGTGKAAAPYRPMTKIGWGYQVYRDLF